MKYLTLAATIFTMAVTPLAAQEADSVITYQRYIDRVLAYHPISKIADMEIDKAQALLLDARAGFEPSLNAIGDSKTLDNKNYWDKRSVDITMATPIGVKLKTGYETADGDFLNPENNTPKSGQWFTEVELPLLRGLLTDKRRIQLKKAANQVEVSRALRRQMQNTLLMDATNAFWQWKQTWDIVALAGELTRLASERHQGVVQGYRNGEFAAIDTLESYNQWLNRRQNQRQAFIEEIKARAEFTSYLWRKNMAPVPLPQNIAPDQDIADINLLDPFTTFENPLEAAMRLPQSKIARFKRDNKVLENRLAREQLKPEFNINWKQFAGSDIEGGTVDIADNQVALTFKIPLFLRSSRAAVQASQIQLNNAEIRLEQKVRNLSLKLQADYQQIQQLQEQLKITNQIAENFFQLVKAEEQEFMLGESSIFLVNQRENRYQEARQKAIKAENKLSNNVYKLYWLLQQDLDDSINSF